MSSITARRRDRSCWAWFLGAAIVLPSPAAAQVINGDFEAVQIGTPFRSTNPADIPGWIHSGTMGDGLLWHVGYSDSGGTVVAAGHGLQFVTMGGGFGGSGSASWDQTINGLISGTLYNVNFQMSGEGAGSGSGPQSITVDFPSGSSSGSQTFTAGASPTIYWGSWEDKTAQFVATSSSVELRFSATTPFDVGLDFVRVTPAPEPGSLALLAVAAVPALLARIRRRYRALLLTHSPHSECSRPGL
jgi:hypothetical protein